MANNPYVNKVQTADGTTLIDLSQDTVTSASDIVSGKVGHLADGSQVTGTASGGGGASNYVTGTFTGTTTGAMLDINVGYTGGGYPIGLLICPSEGSYSKINSNSFYSTIQQYAIAQFSMTKANMSVAPSYTSSNKDEGTATVVYKSSASNATTLSRTSSPSQYSYDNNGASSTSTKTAVFKNATTLSVYIASSSFGFAANIPYTYHIMYSE